MPTLKLREHNQPSSRASARYVVKPPGLPLASALAHSRRPAPDRQRIAAYSKARAVSAIVLDTD